VLPVAGPFASSLSNYLLQFYGYELDDIVLVATLFLVLLALLWASLRSLGKQTIWDKLSGTMVRYRTGWTTTI